jgi:hypothetical protein
LLDKERYYNRIHLIFLEENPGLASFDIYRPSWEYLKDCPKFISITKALQSNPVVKEKKKRSVSNYNDDEEVSPGGSSGDYPRPLGNKLAKRKKDEEDIMNNVMSKLKDGRQELNSSSVIAHAIKDFSSMMAGFLNQYSERMSYQNVSPELRKEFEELALKEKIYKMREEQAQRQAEEAQRQADEARQRQTEETNNKHQVDETRQRQVEETNNNKRQADETHQRQVEETNNNKRQADETRQRQVEETNNNKRQADETQRQADEARQREAEEAQREQEEKRLRLEDEERKVRLQQEEQLRLEKEAEEEEQQRKKDRDEARRVEHERRQQQQSAIQERRLITQHQDKLQQRWRRESLFRRFSGMPFESKQDESQVIIFDEDNQESLPF